MPLIERILFPVNFSHSCTAMAAYVKRASAILGAQVTLLNVAEYNTYTGIEMAFRGPDDIANDLTDAARQRLDAYLTNDLPLATRIVRVGDPAAEIVQAARDIHASMIMMPTHAGAFRSMLLGSTTAKVLNDSDCPVFTSRHAETIAPRPIEHREWLCAIGLTSDSERVLRFASGISTQARGHISIIHAVQANQHDVPPGFELKDTFEAVARDRATLKLEELKQKVGIEADISISFGNVKHALLTAAQQFDADVLVIGRSPHDGPIGRLRDLTYATVRDSSFPVISI